MEGHFNDFFKTAVDEEDPLLKIGYACINVSLPQNFRACRAATAEREGTSLLKQLTLDNLELTKKIMEWNIEHGILFYRMSSDLVVLATHPVNKWDWQSDIEVQTVCEEIKALKIKYQLRLSMHPGQYSVLNSPRPQVVENTIKDLMYHAKLMDLTGATDMILHLGGEYGDKTASLDRLIERTLELPPTIKEKLRFENDDKSYNITDVLFVSEKTKVPACLDFHHHRCNPSKDKLDLLLPSVWETWEGIPKVHISSGREFDDDRRHHDYIKKDDFQQIMEDLKGKEVDVMVEAKQKNLAVLKLMEQFNV